MATYMLAGVDDEQWRQFKAICDLEGITIKESFLHHINITIKASRGYLNYHKGEDHKPKKGGKNT